MAEDDYETLTKALRLSQPGAGQSRPDALALTFGHDRYRRERNPTVTGRFDHDSPEHDVTDDLVVGHGDQAECR